MKKSRIAIIILAVLNLIFLIPIPYGTADDGGSREFTALTYKIVKWNHIVDADETYTGTDFYLLPDNFKSMSELWEEKGISSGAGQMTSGDNEDEGVSDSDDVGPEDSVSSKPAESSSSQADDVVSTVNDKFIYVLSEKMIKNTYVLSTKHPNNLDNFTVVRTLNDKANGIIENLLAAPNFASKNENEWVKFRPSRPNEYALAIEFTDDTCLIIAIHFTKDSDTYYIAEAESNSKFDEKADYSSLDFQRGIASEDLGKYLGNLTFNYSE